MPPCPRPCMAISASYTMPPLYSIVDFSWLSPARLSYGPLSSAGCRGGGGGGGADIIDYITTIPWTRTADPCCCPFICFVLCIPRIAVAISY